MDTVIVIIIVGIAIAFTVRSFIKVYKGEKSCGCGSGCSCNSEDSCNTNKL